MKHIMNVLKNEICNRFSEMDGLVKKVTVSQESYLKNRGNESLYDSWSENVKDLQKAESDMRHLRAAYSEICEACGTEPKSNEDIVAEKIAKAVRKSERKSRKSETKQDENKDGENE